MIRVERQSGVQTKTAATTSPASKCSAPIDLDLTTSDLCSDSEDSGSSGDEIPIWVRGEQRWVSGVDRDTTCQDLKIALLSDETAKGKSVGEPEHYHITERWRGVEQPLDDQAPILEIWNAWGNAQSEVKLSLRRVSSSDATSRRRRHHHKAESTCSSGRHSQSHTLHPKRLFALAGGNNHHDIKNLPHNTNTEELLKLVLAQGEIIRKQLRRLRHSENQIGFLEDKTHRARVRKHGSNYLLETYLKGLPDALDTPEGATTAESPAQDKNSDSGVMTENDSGEPTTSTQNPFDRLSPSYSDSKEDENSASEELAKDMADAFETISKINKKLLKEEEKLARLHISIKKYERNKNDYDKIYKSLTELRAEMAKSSCEMQHNAIVLDETNEALDSRKVYLNELHKEILRVDQEYDMLMSMKLSQEMKNAHISKHPNNNYHFPPYTKELNTLV